MLHSHPTAHTPAASLSSPLTLLLCPSCRHLQLLRSLQCGVLEIRGAGASHAIGSLNHTGGDTTAATSLLTSPLRALILNHHRAPVGFHMVLSNKAQCRKTSLAKVEVKRVWEQSPSECHHQHCLEGNRKDVILEESLPGMVFSICPAAMTS